MRTNNWLASIFTLISRMLVTIELSNQISMSNMVLLVLCHKFVAMTSPTGCQSHDNAGASDVFFATRAPFLWAEEIQERDDEIRRFSLGLSV
jgi:hypothetical protein